MCVRLCVALQMIQQVIQRKESAFHVNIGIRSEDTCFSIAQ